MVERFQELFRIPNRLYTNACPVIVETAVLQKDLSTKKILVQIKLKNIGKKWITSTKVLVHAYEPNGAELEGVSGFSFLDLNVRTGQDYGSRIPVYMPDPNTRSISVEVTEIVFSDGSIWHSEKNIWEPIPVQTRISDYYEDPEMRKQVELEVGTDCKFIPLLTDELFLCSCGAVNLVPNDACYKCHRKVEDLHRALDEESLISKRDARLQKEKEECEERERKEAEEAERARKTAEEKKRKAKKIASIVIPIIVIASIIAALTPNYIKPAVNNTMTYFEARRLLKEGSFDEAKHRFDSLNGFLNAEEMSKMSVYRKADKYYLDKDYYNAIQAWSSIKDYEDSGARIETATEDYYQAGIDAAQKEDFDKAKDIFKHLGQYKDSKSQYIVSCYSYAVQLAEKGNYEEAIIFFDLSSGYKDADDLKIDSIYNYGCQLASSSDYKNAIKQFKKCASYKDADSLLIDAKYNYGCQLIDSKKYVVGITQLNDVSDYKDSKSRINDAKFAYVKANKNSNDHTTYSYLKDLVKIGYSGARSLYDELFTWKATIKINNGASSVKWNRRTDVDIKISGGEPGVTKKVRARITYPNGEVQTSANEWVNVTVGGDFSFYWDNGVMQGPINGTLTVRVYDSDGNLLGLSSIKVTS
ncbi:MAG: tetratricopeptide repeat protein [Oscillospiraceae bacterium]|nr:tetratricopeptide repeat protein [Oscillospiraceae bacterium]